MMNLSSLGSAACLVVTLAGGLVFEVSSAFAQSRDSGCYEMPFAIKTEISHSLLDELLRRQVCIKLKGVVLSDVWLGPPPSAVAVSFVCQDCVIDGIAINEKYVTTEIRLMHSQIGTVSISDSTFARQLAFVESTIHRRVDVLGSRFHEGLDLTRADVFASVDFRGSIVDGALVFRGARFLRTDPDIHPDPSYGENVPALRITDVNIAERADFSGVRIDGAIEVDSSIMAGGLDLRDAVSASSEPVPIRIQSSILEGHLRVGPLSGRPFSFSLGKTWLSRVEVPWHELRSHLSLDEMSATEKTAFMDRMGEIYRIDGKREDLRQLEYDKRDWLEDSAVEISVNRIDRLLTGHGYALYRIPLIAITVVVAFASVFWLKARNANVPSVRRVRLAVLYGFASLWGAELRVETNDVQRASFRASIADSLEVCEIIGLLTASVLSLALAVYLSA